MALSATSCVSASYSVQYWRDTVQILDSPNDSSANVLTPTATYIKISGTSTSTLQAAVDTAWEAGSSTCSNALKAFHLTLTYNK